MKKSILPEELGTQFTNPQILSIKTDVKTCSPSESERTYYHEPCPNCPTIDACSCETTCGCDDKCNCNPYCRCDSDYCYSD